MPKYRRKALYGEVREEIRDVLRKLVAAKDGIEVVEGSVCGDHIHLCLRIAPKWSVAKVMGCLKGESALVMFDHHPEWRKLTGRDRTLWARGYYVSTVGINGSVIKKYVREQEDASRIAD
jgi:putative transposase